MSLPDVSELYSSYSRVGRQNYMEEGYLDPQERAIILGNAGCEAQSFEKVEAEVNMIIAHRRESNEVDIEFMYALGEYGDSDLDENAEDEEDEVDKDAFGSSIMPNRLIGCTSSYFGANYSGDDCEWKQTLDIIARSDNDSDSESGGENTFPSNSNAGANSDIFNLASSEKFPSSDLSASLSDLESDTELINEAKNTSAPKESTTIENDSMRREASSSHVSDDMEKASKSLILAVSNEADPDTNKMVLEKVTTTFDPCGNDSIEVV